MPSWDKKDDANSAPKFLVDDANAKPESDLSAAVFVDNTESSIASNRAKGLKASGWNLYHTYTDSEGNTRHKTETLVAMDAPQSVSVGDLGVSGNTDIEDTIAADS